MDGSRLITVTRFICIFLILIVAPVFSGCSYKADWNLQLEGARNETIPQGYFEKGVSEDCHHSEFTDENGTVWVGMPLWLLVGRVDDEDKHKEGGYNDALADKGYEIQIITVDGMVTYTSQEMKRNGNIIVAYESGRVSTPGEVCPLVLVGSGVDSVHRVRNITLIKLVFPTVP